MDFFNSFLAHPDTGRLLVKTGEREYSQSIRNLVLTNIGDRPFENRTGSNIRSLLYDIFTDQTKDLVSKLVREAVSKEKNVSILDVVVESANGNKSIIITIAYTFLGSAAPVVMSISLSRVR
jgi:phage baseplate assembly protein W